MKPQGRPKKYRIVQKDPQISQFSPRGRPGRPDEIELGIDEYEAIRLADFGSQSQQEAAKSMQVSQQTFSRILKRARRKVSEALVYGKIIRIQGGHYMISARLEPQEKRTKPTAKTTEKPA